jgi:UDP-N-acetylmuramoyl-tripeptide--D-alanyl-D-alanine ligase
VLWRYGQGAGDRGHVDCDPLLPDSFSYNHAFGEKMASCCDLVFLVGKKHTKPIYDGLIQNGFPVENIFTTQTLDEAIRTMNPMLREGDVIMYENDLPDHYSEV